MNLTLARTTWSLLLALAAATPALAAYDIIPTAVGNKWEYDTVKILHASVMYQGKQMSEMRDASYGSSVYEVLSADAKAPGVVNYVEKTTTWSVNGGDADTNKTEIRLATDDAGLKIMATTSDPSNGSKPETQSYDPALLYFVRGAEAGKSWDVGTMRDGESINPMTAKAAGRETVTVPAGTFKNCLKVVYSGDNIAGTMDMWGKTFTLTSGKSRGVYWIADGVGVVKELEISTSTAETPSPEGKPLSVEAASCTVSELRPGYVVKK